MGAEGVGDAIEFLFRHADIVGPASKVAGLHRVVAIVLLDGLAAARQAGADVLARVSAPGEAITLDAADSKACGRGRPDGKPGGLALRFDLWPAKRLSPPVHQGEWIDRLGADQIRLHIDQLDLAGVT